MNILLDAWIPVEHAEGVHSQIAPIDLPGSDALRVAHPRADHSALLTELLVCIFQTLAPPRDDRQKLSFLNGSEAPLAQELRSQARAFELFGDGPRFLQSRTDLSRVVEAAYLAYETPASNTLEKNNDLFVSREAVQSVCPSCAATGLFLCQSHARAGGTGYFGGPRGTNALTALLEGPSLWQTVCLNLLTPEQFAQVSNVHAAPNVPSFPWLSHAKGFERAPTWDELGRYGVLWWTPVALRLNESENTEGQPCGLCGEVRDVHITSVAKEATPFVPQGIVRHPHTGWRNKPAKKESAPPKKKSRPGPSPVEVPPLGFTAETWCALVLGDELTQSLAAHLYLKNRRWAAQTQLRVFGAATKNNSLLWWLDQTRPVIFAPTESERQALQATAGHLLNIIRRAAKALANQIMPSFKVGRRVVRVPLLQTSTQALTTLWDQASTELIALVTRLEGGELLEEDLKAFKANCRRVTLDLFDESVSFNTYDPVVTAKLLELRAKLDRALWKL
jgi:CRISPR system Cascade subunit CasA